MSQRVDSTAFGASRPTTPAAGALSRLTPAGRFRPEDVPALRDWVHGLRATRLAPDHPAGLFGPWAALPPRAHAVLRAAVEAEMRRTLALAPRGRLWTGAVRRARELDRFMHRTGILPRTRGRLVKWTGRLHGGPHTIGRRLALRRGRRRWERGQRPGPADLLAALGRTPRWLLGDFVEGVPMDPRLRGYFEDPARRMTWGYHVGLDLMRTRDGICLVEANLQPGILARDDTVYQLDRLVSGIHSAAEAHGARRVLWLEGDNPPVPPDLWRGLREEGERRGLAFSLLEDPCVRSRPPESIPAGWEPPRRWTPGMQVPPETLVIRRSEYPTGPDHLVADKEPSIRALHAWFTETGEERVHTLPMSRVPPPLDTEDDDVDLPNLVYKYPDSFAGKGVFFLRVRSPEEAVKIARRLDAQHGEPPGLFQRFRLSRLPGTRRAFDVRAEVLITPGHTWHLRLMRRVAGRDLPERVPHGLLEGRGVFTANINTGGTLSCLDPAMAPPFQAAAEAVAEGLRGILERTFEVRPTEGREGGRAP